MRSGVERDPAATYAEEIRSLFARALSFLFVCGLSLWITTLVIGDRYASWAPRGLLEYRPATFGELTSEGIDFDSATQFLGELFWRPPVNWLGSLFILRIPGMLLIALLVYLAWFHLFGDDPFRLTIPSAFLFQSLLQTIVVEVMRRQKIPSETFPSRVELLLIVWAVLLSGWILLITRWRRLRQLRQA